ncbi:unnamed protein product [Symbiodinium sp. CCMP2592]|nr:unnamed protein product [Symbiodinium sp. CCMP2592]
MGVPRPVNPPQQQAQNVPAQQQAQNISRSPPWKPVPGKSEEVPPPPAVDLTEEDGETAPKSPQPKARPIKIHKIAMFPIDWGKSALEIFARVVPLVTMEPLPTEAASGAGSSTDHLLNKRKKPSSEDKSEDKGEPDEKTHDEDDKDKKAENDKAEKNEKHEAEIKGDADRRHRRDRRDGKEKDRKDRKEKDHGKGGEDNEEPTPETSLEKKFQGKSSRKLEEELYNAKRSRGGRLTHEHVLNPCLFQEANGDVRSLVCQRAEQKTPDSKEKSAAKALSEAPRKRKAEAAEPLSCVKPRRLEFGSGERERHDSREDGAGDSSSENRDEDDEETLPRPATKALEDLLNEDSDLFKDKFALAVPAEAPASTPNIPAIMDGSAEGSKGASWDQLPRVIRSKLEKIDSDLIDALPTCLSSSDFPHFLDILLAEDILNLNDAVEFVSELGGQWLDNLGEQSKTIQAKMTLKGRKQLSTWPEMLKAAQQDVDVNEGESGEVPKVCPPHNCSSPPPDTDGHVAGPKDSGARRATGNMTIVKQLTEAWLVELQTHIIRASDYKGKLLVSGSEVNLEAWAATLEFLGVHRRWQTTKLFTPATQLASDFLYRYWQNHADKQSNNCGQDLNQQTFRSLELIVDASPKGKLDVWSPIGFAGRVAAALPLQRLSALAISTASVQTKMQEGQKIIDKFAETGENQAKLKKMHLGSTKTRPKAISSIRQKKLSAREQMRACMHVLSVLDLELLVGDSFLRPLDAQKGEKRMVEDGKAWLWDPSTGEAAWDCLTPRHQSNLRLVLAPDEGSTLWSAFTFLASQSFKVNFVRDELSTHKLQNHYLRTLQCNKAVKRTWRLSEWLMKAKKGPWAHSEDLLQELFASSILAENGWDPNAEGTHAFENVCSIGINPFADMGVAATGDDGQQYNRIMDCCVRALVDEEAHKLFESLQFFTEGLGPQGMASMAMMSDLDVHGLATRSPACLSKELRVAKRRCSVQQDLLRDHLDLCLVTLYELGSYQLYLTAAPASSACLLLEESTEVSDLEAVQSKVLQALKFEWATVLSMEASKNTADLLHKLCPHVKWQVYRETLVGLESDGFHLTQTVRDLVMAWFPRLSFSANVEEQFSCMQDSVKRGSKGGTAGITNLSTVGVKALYSKMLDGPGQAASVKLQDCDWEGTTVRALKQKLFQPETFTGSQDLHLDTILSSASGTSAHQHNKGTLNYMKAFLEALKLREIELSFHGELPPETIDENSVAKNVARWEAEDCLKAVLQLNEVKQHISEKDVQDIGKMCEEMDAKRRNRSANAEQEDDDDEQPEAFELMEEPDPTLAAANELLALIGDDDEEELPLAERGDAADAANTLRESRRLLTGKFNNKGSCSASYNDELPKEEVDLAKVETKSLAPEKRSQSQAYYMTWTWANEAMKDKRRRTQ